MPGFNNDTSDTGGTAGGTDALIREEVDQSLDKGWTVLLYNDPVSPMDYVTNVLIKILEIPKEKAESLMLTVHKEGKAAVFHGTKDEAEAINLQFSAASLWSKSERAA